MLFCSSTSWLVCQKKRYGEIVVPSRATRIPIEPASKGLGIRLPAMTAPISGCAKRAAPMYASRARASHLKMRAMS